MVWMVSMAGYNAGGWRLAVVALATSQAGITL